MSKSERRQGEEQQDRVANIVAAILNDADADLWNWADEAVRVDAMHAVYALGKLAAAAVQTHAEQSRKPSSEILMRACEVAFGRQPRIA